MLEGGIVGVEMAELEIPHQVVEVFYDRHFEACYPGSPTSHRQGIEDSVCGKGHHQPLSQCWFCRDESQLVLKLGVEQVDLIAN